MRMTRKDHQAFIQVYLAPVQVYPYSSRTDTSVHITVLIQAVFHGSYNSSNFKILKIYTKCYNAYSFIQRVLVF